MDAPQAREEFRQRLPVEQRAAVLDERRVGVRHVVGVQAERSRRFAKRRFLRVLARRLHEAPLLLQPRIPDSALFEPADDAGEKLAQRAFGVLPLQPFHSAVRKIYRRVFVATGPTRDLESDAVELQADVRHRVTAAMHGGAELRVAAPEQTPPVHRDPLGERVDRNRKRFPGLAVPSFAKLANVRPVDKNAQRAGGKQVDIVGAPIAAFPVNRKDHATPPPLWANPYTRPTRS